MNINKTYWSDITILLIFLGVLFFLLLGTRPLFVPDEGRYAEIAREMVGSSNYVTPYLNGIKYFEKPILFYWLSASAIKIGGLNLWALRSVNALLGLIGCILTYCTARKLYDRRTGFLAAFILGTSTLYFVMARMINLDLTVTVFLSMSLYAFLLSIQYPPGQIRRLYMWGAGVSVALAVLTKGLIGLIFPMMIIGAWIAILNEWRLLKQLYLPSTILIFFLIAAPWHLLVGYRNPEFFYFYFIEQHFLRYTSMAVGHYQPAWFFIPVLILGFFPWIVFLPQTFAGLIPKFWKQRQKYKAELFLFLWAVLVFAFFSFSKSKLIPYILPVIPPLAILTARYLQQATLNKKILGIKVGYFFLILLAMVITYEFYSFTHSSLLPNSQKAGDYLLTGGIILILGAMTSCILAFRNVRLAVIVTVGSTALFLITCIAAMPSIDTRTILPLATSLKLVLKPDDEVITFNQYYQDLPFYLERQVNILNWRNELTFGMQHQPNHDWMLNDAEFWKHWHSKKRVFVLMAKDAYANFQKTHSQEKTYLLAKTLNTALVSNKPK